VDTDITISRLQVQVSSLFVTIELDILLTMTATRLWWHHDGCTAKHHAAPHAPMHSTIFETQDLELGECVWKYLKMRYLGYLLDQ
jgi:hypothetical protein